MSDPTYYTRLTDIGSAALNNAITGGASIALTELALGDANGASYDPDGAETTLVNEQYRLAISSIAPDAQNPAWLIVEAIIPPDVGGWWIREAGIFDANGDMFAIAKYPETYKAVLSDGTASTLTIQIVLQVTNTDSIELVVNPLDGYATQGWVVSAYPWATEEEATNAQVENKLIDPKRLAYALSHLDLASGEDLLSLSQTLDQDLSAKADADHTHDDRYYTKSISDERFLEKGATAANATNATKLGGHLASFFAAAASLSNFYDKAASDGRYLGKSAKAADSDKLDGKHASELGSSAAILEDQKASGTDSQVGSKSWYTRHLNTEVSDPDGIVSLKSNQFTVSKNCFAIITIPGRDASYFRLWNVTNNRAATGVTYSYSTGGYTFSNTFFAPLLSGETYRVEQQDSLVLSNITASGRGTEVYTRVLIIA
nr:phage tail protein [uncultured Cohaesibacter sp.]